LAPLLVEGLELLLGAVGVDSGVDRLEVPGDLLALAPRDVLEAVADQVNDACLNDGLRGCPRTLGGDPATRAAGVGR
jgi:hypothetical protein